MSKFMGVFLVAAIVVPGLALGAQGARGADSGKRDPVNTLVTTGYIDVQYSFGRGSLDLDGVNSTPGNGNSFYVNQGSMMLTDDFENSSFSLDLSFRQSTTTGTQSNDLELGTEEAQAFIAYNFSSRWSAKFGQFDSEIGLESNDTPDIVFPKQGLLWEIMPVTHTGIQGSFRGEDTSLHVVVGNGNQAGRQPSDHGPDFGAQWAIEKDGMEFTVAALYSDTKGNYPLVNNTVFRDRKPRWLFDSTAEVEFGRIKLNAEVAVVRSPYDKTAVAGVLQDHDLAYGFLIGGEYSVNEDWSLAIRYESLKNEDSNPYVQQVQSGLVGQQGNTYTGQEGLIDQISIATRHMLNDQLMAKAGFDSGSVNVGKDAPGNKTAAFTAVHMAMVYNF